MASVIIDCSVLPFPAGFYQTESITNPTILARWTGTSVYSLRRWEKWTENVDPSIFRSSPKASNNNIWLCWNGLKTEFKRDSTICRNLTPKTSKISKSEMFLSNHQKRLWRSWLLQGLQLFLRNLVYLKSQRKSYQNNKSWMSQCLNKSKRLFWKRGKKKPKAKLKELKKY